MQFKELGLKGVWLIETHIFPDERGSFMEAYNEKSTLGTPLEGIHFVQDNISCSHKGVFRGMHAQQAPYGQSKYVRAISGKLLDIVLDIAPQSSTFGEAISVELSATSGLSLFIPPHYAHGFLALEENTRLYYKVDTFYHPSAEIAFNYQHPSVLALIEPFIPLDQLILSPKDRVAPPLLP